MKAICINCNNGFLFIKSQQSGKFCGTKCSGEHRSKKHKENWYKGVCKGNPDRSTFRKYLAEDRGYKCELCGLGEIWNGTPITLQVDHIDGNPGDNSPQNLRLLCPNCHSQTPFRGQANKGRGRKALGLPLQ